MIFTGNNILKLPRVNEYSFILENIRISDWSECRFIFSGLSIEKNIFLQSGFIYASDKQKIISTYNTGEPFSITGWFINEPSNNTGNNFILSTNNIWNIERNNIRETLDSIGINVLASSLQCDVSIYGYPILLSFVSPEEFPIGGQLTGIFSSSSMVWSYGHTLEFYNSLEQSLTGEQIFGCLGSGQEPIELFDNDSSEQNNDFSWNLRLNVSDGEQVFTTQTARTGLFDWTFRSLTGFNDSNVLLYPFEGIWSGRNFLYSGDNPSYLTLGYFAAKMDGLGNVNSSGIRITGVCSGIKPLNATAYSGTYITGFLLTSSGEYLSPPIALFSGYYYVTGIQQSLNSILLNSGCSGNIGIRFSGINGWGTGATGKLLTTLIQFQNVYGSGNKSYYVVSAYSGISGGTGYTQAPKAFIDTGEWGNQCFDVPLRSGYNEGWFTPFNTYGSAVISAGYLTGEVLYTTGLISGGLLTGYKVTGLEITNLGSGYSINLPPLVKFVRDVSDNFTGTGASGQLQIRTTGEDSTYSFVNVWKLATGLVGQTPENCPNVNFTIPFSFNLPPGQNYFNLVLRASGIDITEPMGVHIKMGFDNISLLDVISGVRTYSTDPYTLKKKLNILTGIYAENNELGFLLTQSELDEFYSSEAYINNIFNISLGDLDF